MYYEKQILPLDNSGNFLLAVHFQQHKIGGERTSESQHAYFAYGNVDSLDDLTDITSLCCLDKTTLIKKRRFVPRKVLASKNGTVIVGIECSNEAVQRVIDIFNGEVSQELKETKWPKANIIAYPHAISMDGKSIICTNFTKSPPNFNEQSINKGILKRKTLATYSKMCKRESKHSLFNLLFFC